MSSPDHARVRLAEEIAAALPPRRDDEPASLRQEIFDELGDHLTCAFRRELLRTNGDGERAETNVRQRFGDPRRIARRLWFDAMRSRLMLQKVLIGTCAALVAACLLFGFLLWQALAEMRAMNASLVRQSNEANAAILAQSQQANAALLEQLRKLEQASALSDPQWNPVTIRLVKGTKDGPPAAGFDVALQAIGREEGSFHGKTGSDGIADCGLMQPSTYSLVVTSPWDERLDRHLEVRPGRAVELTIVCPAAAPNTVPVEWQVDWPAKLNDLESRDDIWLLALIDGELNRTFGNDSWRLNGGRRLLAFHADGRIVNLSTAEATSDVLARARHSATIQQFLQVREKDNALVEGAQAWAGGVYRNDELGLARWDGRGTPFQLLLDSRKPAVDFGQEISAGVVGGTIGSVLQIHRRQPTFTAPARGPVTWTIDVPAGLFTWAEMRARPSNASVRDFVNLYEEELMQLFPREGDPVPLDEREPVEALRLPTEIH